MSWALLTTLVLVLAAAWASLRVRRAELEESARVLAERARARERGSDRARLQYPQVDLARCIGCGICVAACPEEGVLEVIHGQAVVVHGARCVGHGRCAQECPVGAIALTLADLETRRDLPALTEGLEAPRSPGLFLAGEVTGYALIRTAITHGSSVAREIARRKVACNGHAGANGALDLCVVGAGPAGIACSLEAKAQGLSFVTLDQERLGGTVAKYPRRKLVMTQPVELPLFGRLERTSYTKEELMELWERIAREQQLPFEPGQEFTGLERCDDGTYLVRTRERELRAHNVAICVGRRGTPRKLGVPGEELPKVAYSLLDAQSYTGRRILVVGGGDSAIEAALGLAEQPGNEVTLSYRKAAFTRIKPRNELRIQQAIDAGHVRPLFESEVDSISEDAVELRMTAHPGERLHVPNDEVFVFAGGEPPYRLLEQCGVSFDPADRQGAEQVVDRGAGLQRALTVALVVAVLFLGWTLWFREYYGLPLVERAGARLHEWLRPSGRVGLGFGIAGAAAILANLAYLARRSPRVPFEKGSLQAWMTAHVTTGVLALLFAIVHSAMAPRHTVGGHALAGLCGLVLTGAIGRYFYAFVPRATNGRELMLEEVRSALAGLSSEWDRAHPELGAKMRAELEELVSRGHWQSSFLRRVGALLSSQRRLRAALVRLRREGRRLQLGDEQLAELESLARRAHRAALAAGHYAELRGLLATWRYFHRWVALMMVLLLGVHVFVALRYAELFGGGAP